jgi:hypothetical protein
MRGELQELIGKSRHFVRSADVHPSDFSKTVRLVYRALRIIEAIEESGTSEAVANAREQGRLCYGVLDRLLKIKENKRENSYSVIVGVQTAFILNECEAKRRSLQNAEKAYC